MMNPFKPNEVKLFNYNKENIENQKLNMTREKTQLANGQTHEYTKNYKPKSYSDVIKRPQSYGDAINKPLSYGDARNNLPVEPGQSRLDHVNNINRINKKWN